MKSPLMLVVVAVGCLAVGAAVGRLLLSGGAPPPQPGDAP
jgi:hypothetical protein